MGGLLGGDTVGGLLNIRNHFQCPSIYKKPDLMNSEFLNQIKIPDAILSEKFKARKGCFIIDFDPIMTENQIVAIEQEYQLVEFKSGGEIKVRDVVFWLGSLKRGMLKILCYDINNKIVIQKIHDVGKLNNYSDWFLISEDYFGAELLEFEF